MNWVDWIIILVIFLFTLEGLGRSFIGEVLDFISFLAALLLSLRFYNQAASLLQTNFNLAHSLANVLGFFIVWSAVEIVLGLIIHLSLDQLSFLSKLDRRLRPLSIVPSFLRGLIFVAIILVLLGTFPIQPRVKSAVDSSVLGQKILAQAYQLDAPLKGVFGGITQDTLSFLTVEPATNESVNLGFKTTDFTLSPNLENQMIGLVNNERVSRGLKALSFDTKLREIARAHSEDMFERGYFSHYSPEGKTVADRANSAGIDYLVIGENLAFAPSLSLAHQGLMNSPGHRANILSTDYHKIGIGIAVSADYGLMITQDFSN